MALRINLPKGAQSPGKLEPKAKPGPLNPAPLTVAPFAPLSSKPGGAVPAPAPVQPTARALPPIPGARPLPPVPPAPRGLPPASGALPPLTGSRPPLPALPKAGATVKPLPPGAIPPGVVVSEVADPPPRYDGSGALLTHSSSPAMIRAAGLIFKWAFFGGVLLGVGFLAMRFLVPFLKELNAPKTATVVVDKNAPMAVQMLQQTRQVVAKSDANVGHVNEVLDLLDNKPAASKAAPKQAPAPPPAPAAPPKPLVKGDLTPYQEAVARVKFGGVFEGGEPRAYLDGRIVKYGEIFNRELGLRFLGVDLEEHALLFTNADNVTFRKYY